MALGYEDIKYLPPHESLEGIQLRLLSRMGIQKCERDIIEKVTGTRYLIKAGPSSPRHDHAMVYTTASIFHRLLARSMPSKLDMTAAFEKMFLEIRNDGVGDWDEFSPHLPDLVSTYWKLAVRCYATNLALNDVWGLAETSVHYIMQVKGLNRRMAVRFLEYQMIRTYVDPVMRPSMLRPVVAKYINERYTMLVETRGKTFSKWCEITADYAIPAGELRIWIDTINRCIRYVAGDKTDEYLTYINKMTLDHMDSDNPQKTMTDAMINANMRWLLPAGSLEEVTLPTDLRHWLDAVKRKVHIKSDTELERITRIGYIDTAIDKARKRTNPIDCMIRKFEEDDLKWLIPTGNEVADEVTDQWLAEFRSKLEPHGPKYLAYVDGVAARHHGKGRQAAMMAEFTEDGYSKLFPTD